MGSFISGIVSGESSASKRAKEQKRQVQVANEAKEKKLKKQRGEEALVAQSKGKKRIKVAGRRRRVVTSPLGLTESGTDTLA